MQKAFTNLFLIFCYSYPHIMNLYWQNYLPLFLHYYLFPKFKYYYTTSISILWHSLLYFPGSLSQMICLSTTANTFYFKCDEALNKWWHFFKFSNERWFSSKYSKISVPPGALAPAYFYCLRKNFQRIWFKLNINSHT